MSVISFIQKLRYKPSLIKQDIDAGYAPIIQVVGGTYWLSGVSNGPNQGTLDYKNFTQNAGILNNNKASPNSIFVLQPDSQAFGTITGGTTVQWTIPMPYDFSSFVPNNAVLTIIGFSVSAASISSGTNQGTVTLAQLTPALVSTSISAPTYTNIGTANVVVANVTGLSFVYSFGSSLTINWNAVTANVTGPSLQVWAKMQHLKI